MPILHSEEALWQLAGDVSNLLIVEKVNDVCPQKTVDHFADYKELNTELLECSFFIALVLCRLLRKQTKPARNWTFTSVELLENTLTASVQDCSNQLGCQRLRILLLGGMGIQMTMTKLTGMELCGQALVLCHTVWQWLPIRDFPPGECFCLCTWA